MGKTLSPPDSIKAWVSDKENYQNVMYSTTPNHSKRFNDTRIGLSNIFWRQICRLSTQTLRYGSLSICIRSVVRESIAVVVLQTPSYLIWIRPHKNAEGTPIDTDIRRWDWCAHSECPSDICTCHGRTQPADMLCGLLHNTPWKEKMDVVRFWQSHNEVLFWTAAEEKRPKLHTLLDLDFRLR